MIPVRPPNPFAVALALAVVAGLAFAGVNPALAGLAGLAWIGSLCLAPRRPKAEAAPVTPPAPAPTRADTPTRDAVREVLEPLERPLLLLEKTRIIIANAAARAALGTHIEGQDARIALRRPEALKLLDLADGASVNAPGLTGGRSFWRLTRRRVDETRWLIELVDRTAETDLDRAHTDFVANASHELRTPLAAIIGCAETLMGEAAPAEPALRDRFVNTIAREANRMLLLIQDLMALSHVEAEKHDAPTERVDLAALACRVVGEVASLKGKERVTLGETVRPAEALADAAQLEQVLRNLTDNSLKYGGAETPVTVTVTTPFPGRVRLAVSDRGPGIAPEHLPHLTRRFYRADNSRSRASGGTGLGLAIVKHIVERHGGELDIASVLGEGTTVSVTLPAAPAPAAPVTAPITESA
jgi:two-component system, OmpR family, phosphate regulon sensor histidine kinase PhoR